MPVLKMVATEQLRILVAELIAGNAFLMVPASPDNACERDLYVRILLRSSTTALSPSSAAWKRCVVLLIAICLSAACSVLAVSTFEDGLRYRNGCAAATEVGWLLLALVVLVGVVLPAQGFFAWVTVFEH